MKEPTDRRGTTRTKTILALVLVVLVAVGAYGVLNFQTQTSSNLGQTTTTGSQTRTTTSVSQTRTTTTDSQQPGGLLGLFGTFSHMGASYEKIVQTSGYNGAAGATAQNFTYAVIGHTLVNSTDYFRVEFTSLSGNITTILWFDQRGNVSLAQVGGKNYTGNSALLVSLFLTSLFSLALVDSNATQLSGLQKTGGDIVQNIGGTQVSVSTYELIPSKASPFANDTVRVATIPGTNFRVVVYLNQIPVDPEGTTLFFQVNSLSKG